MSGRLNKNFWTLVKETGMLWMYGRVMEDWKGIRVSGTVTKGSGNFRLSGIGPEN